MAKKLKVKDLAIYLNSNNPIRINSIKIIFFWLEFNGYYILSWILIFLRLQQIPTIINEKIKDLINPINPVRKNSGKTIQERVLKL